MERVTCSWPVMHALTENCDLRFENGWISAKPPRVIPLIRPKVRILRS